MSNKRTFLLSIIIFLCLLNFFVLGADNSDKDMIQLDFNNTDIKLVIKTLSELTGKNFVIDESGGVRGSITVISPKKIHKKDAAQVIESILELNGFSLVPSGSLVKVVHKRKARERNIETEVGNEFNQIPNEDRIITQIIPLNYADSGDIQKTILPLISKDSNITVYTPTNLLIITDIASNIHRLLKIIKNLDVQSAEIKTTIITIKFASAKTIASQITSVFGDTKAKNVRTRAHRRADIKISQPDQRIIKAIADERTNKLVLVANEEDTKTIIDFVESIDKDIETGRDNIHVYYLENSDADELAKVLSNIPLVEKAADKTNPAQARRTTRATGQKPNIVADKFTNALIINEPPENYSTIKKIIKQLDIPRSQVLVEAAIVEMSLDKSLEVGVDWRTLNKPTDGVTTGFAGSNFSVTQKAIPTPTAPFGGAQGLSVGLMKGWMDDGKTIPNVGALLNIFKSDNDFNILSTPQIVTLDNQEAEIVVSDVIPFVTNSRITDVNNVINTYDYKDVGLTLKITPHINKNTGMVRMDIFQEISKVFEADASSEAPRTSKRKAKTSVIVEDAKTIVIGGLIRNDHTMVENKIPLLGDIPFIGFLFKNMKKVNNKTNLMIFITPHIINDSEQFAQISEERKTEFNKLIKNESNVKTLKKNKKKTNRKPFMIDTTVLSYDSFTIE